MTDLIVKSAVKEELDLNVSSDLYEALDEQVEEFLAEAQSRAEENDRRTVQPHDL